MSFGNSTENDLMKKLFNGVTMPSESNSNLYIALHTANPDETGTQSTNEADYTSYARVAVGVTTTGWTVTNNSVANAALVQFPEATGGNNTITHFSVGLTSTGAGQILMKGALNSSRSISNGIQPQFAAGQLTATID